MQIPSPLQCFLVGIRHRTPAAIDLFVRHAFDAIYGTSTTELSSIRAAALGTHCLFVRRDDEPPFRRHDRNPHRDSRNVTYVHTLPSVSLNWLSNALESPCWAS